MSENGEESKDSIQHDPERLAKLLNGGGEPQNLAEAAETLARLLQAAKDGTLPSGGNY